MDRLMDSGLRYCFAAIRTDLNFRYAFHIFLSLSIFFSAFFFFSPDSIGFRGKLFRLGISQEYREQGSDNCNYCNCLLRRK